MALICLDPGHAKNTSGKRSFDSTLLEYEFNRDVASRTAYYLKKYDINYIYTTYYEDTDLALSSRAKCANNNKADLFVSFHANAYGTTWNTANGFETYYYTSKSKSFAETVHKEVLNQIGLKDRGIKTENFTVISTTNMPAILIEYGFYSNQEEVEKLKSADFRDKCAKGTCYGILKYLGISTELKTTEPVVSTPVLEIDYTQHWAYNNFLKLNNSGITLHDMRFNDNITRAESYVILSKILAKINAYNENSISTEYASNDDTHWASSYFNYLNANNVKISETKYADDITRGEVFTLLSNLLNRNGKLVEAGGVEHWAESFYNDLTKNHNLTIHEERYNDKITRGEFITLMTQII